MPAVGPLQQQKKSELDLSFDDNFRHTCLMIAPQTPQHSEEGWRGGKPGGPWPQLLK